MKRTLQKYLKMDCHVRMKDCVLTVTRGEVKQNGMATGPDKIQAEVWKSLGVVTKV